MAGVLNYALTLDASAFSNPLRSARGGLAGFSGAVESATVRVASLAVKIATVAGPLAAAGIAFKAFTKAAEFETMEAGFKGMLGSVEAAKALLEELNALVSSTPYGINDLAQASRSLLAVTTRDELTPKLLMIGDLAALAQRPITDLASMYAKIKGSDKVQGDDLEQISNLNPAALKEFAKVLGVDSVQAVSKLGEEGRITGAALDQVFINLTSYGGPAFEQMKIQAETTTGKMSTLGDSVNALFVTLGTPLNDFLKPIIGNGTELLDQLNAKATAFFQILSSAKEKGNLGEVIGASLKLAFVDGINALSGGLRSVVAYLAAALPPIFKTAVNELTSERSRIFFTSLFAGIGDILRSKLEAAAALILSSLGVAKYATGVNDLNEASKRSEIRGENYLTTASSALATADLGGVVNELAASLKAAEKAGKEAAAEAGENPLINRAPFAEDFAEKAGRANAAALKQFLDPVDKPGFVGPPKPLRAQGPLLVPKPTSPPAGADGNGGNGPGEKPKAEEPPPQPKRKRGLLNESDSQTERLFRNPRGRALGNTDRLAQADFNKRQAKGRGGNTEKLAAADLARRNSRPLSPAAAAERLSRGSSGADPGKSRREEREQAKEKAENPLLAAVNEIKAQLANITSA